MFLTVSFLTGCRAESDVVFLVDSSSYIGPENFRKVKDFILAIVEKLKLYDGQSRIGIITFSGEARVERYLSEPASQDDIVGTIDAITYDGGYPFQVRMLDICKYILIHYQKHPHKA